VALVAAASVRVVDIDAVHADDDRDGQRLEAAQRLQGTHHRLAFRVDASAEQGDVGAAEKCLSALRSTMARLPCSTASRIAASSGRFSVGPTRWGRTS
jgi:hypothetical protein